MSNPFLKAKRLGPPKQHAAFRRAKYPEIWTMDVDALKHLYSITDDKYKKCAITRAINEKLGIKIIKPTEKQEIARKLNYLTFISSGYKKQLLAGIKELDSHLPEMLRTDRDSQLFTAMAKLKVLQQHIEQLMLYIEQINKPEAGTRKRPAKRGTAWKQAEKQLSKGYNHDNQKP